LLANYLLLRTGRDRFETLLGCGGPPQGMTLDLMSARFRRLLLRANGVFLIITAVGAWVTADFPASFLGSGPLASLIAHQPALGIGFIEAHGLAIILGVLLWRAVSAPSWHLTGAAIHLLLGTCNVIFWQLFIVTNTLPMGWITTAIHGLLFVLQSVAAWCAAHDGSQIQHEV
jgi:hypothetical protein